MVQVSKAIKAKAINSNFRTINVVNDIFKNVKSEDGSVSTVMLYPNPSNDKVIVELETIGNYTFIVYNVSGQAVIEQQLTDKRNTINVSQLPEGAYYYELSSANSNTVKGNITIAK